MTFSLFVFMLCAAFMLIYVHTGEYKRAMFQAALALINLVCHFMLASV